MERNSTMSEQSRTSKRIHVYIYEDQIERLFTFWPRANMSEIVRLALENLLEKAKEQQQINLAKAQTQSAEKA